MRTNFVPIGLDNLQSRINKYKREILRGRANVSFTVI